MRSRAPSTRTNRTRQAPPAATRAVAVEGDYPVDARGPRLLASRSRPNQQPTLKPEGLLSALPHVARPPRASTPALVHAVPAQSTRRPLSGSVSLGGRRCANLCAACKPFSEAVRRRSRVVMRAGRLRPTTPNASCREVFVLARAHARLVAKGPPGGAARKRPFSRAGPHPPTSLWGAIALAISAAAASSTNHVSRKPAVSSRK